MMNAHTRKRLTNAFVSSMLGLQLSKFELEEICRAFEMCDPAVSELGRVLRDVAARLGDQQASRKIADSHPTQASTMRNVDIAYEVVRRRRLSRERILNLIRRVAPKTALPVKHHTSTYDLLAEFFSLAPPYLAQEFLEMLNGSRPSTSGDHYLDAITKAAH
jgi:hypothetical protein